MKKRIGLWIMLILMALIACSKSEKTLTGPIEAGDYPAITVALERSPKINRSGAGMDFIHDASLSDTTYLSASTPESFVADVIFYNLMVYFTDDKGDVQSEGCPAMLLHEEAKAIEVGAGVDFFAEFDVITPNMIDLLDYDVPVDFEACKNDSGLYDRTLILAAFDQCVIGNKFRGRILEAPDTETEQDIQQVFLVETVEGGYVKFMVKQFKGTGADKQKTIVQWQVMQF